ncbi:MAG: hypothetical protein JXQ90_09410 [Cyclobacteriaceae bacterium]
MRYVLYILVGCSALISHAQESDESPNPSSYYDSILEIYEGTLARSSSVSAIAHQFYGNMEWASGQIEYNGRVYDDVQMLYDVYTDVLLVKNVAAKDQFEPAIRINQNRIDAFRLNEAQFTQLRDDAPQGISNGIYEVVFQGDKIELLAKRVKLKKMSSGMSGVGDVDYYHQDRYYMFYDSVYVELKSNKSLYEVFPEMSNELKSLVKEMSINVKKQVDTDLVNLMGKCEELLK